MHDPRIIFYRDTKNFGDAFNTFLFSEIIDVKKLPNDTGMVFGVGSILSEKFGLDVSSNVLTLGTGVRGIDINRERTPLHVSNKSWSRGVFSEAISGIESIADGAYAFMLHPRYRQLLDEPRRIEKKLGIIPHYSSLARFPWSRVADAQFKIISPLQDFLDVCREILSCEMVLCEAMHGAIFADMLRVPWLRLDFLSRYFENPEISYLKWNDFYSGVHLLGRNELRLYHLLFEGTLAREYLSKTPLLSLYNGRRVRSLREILATTLGAKGDFQHSDETALRDVRTRIKDKLGSALTHGCV